MSLDEDYDPESEPYDTHPEQDDRVPCPTCHGSGFVLEPDNVEPASQCQPTEDLLAEMDRWHSRYAEWTGPIEARLIKQGAEEIRRLQARVAKLDHRMEDATATVSQTSVAMARLRTRLAEVEQDNTALRLTLDEIWPRGF